MDLLPDWVSFRKYPKKIFSVIIVIAVIIAIGWGLINWDKRKGVGLYFQEIRLISEPIVNYTIKRLELFNSLFVKIVDNSFKGLNNE